MVRIVINNAADIERLQIRLRSLKGILPRLQEVAVKNAADGILDEIHSKMRVNNFSDKIIKATFLGRLDKIGDKLRQHIISNYVSDTGFDVSDAREEGTFHPNKTFPKKPDGVLRWFGPGGKPIFRKWSKPGGIERLLIIEKTIKKSKDKFQDQYLTNLSESVSKVLGV